MEMQTIANSPDFGLSIHTTARIVNQKRRYEQAVMGLQ